MWIDNVRREKPLRPQGIARLVTVLKYTWDLLSGTETWKGRDFVLIDPWK
jgi:hypothetical protein